MNILVFTICILPNSSLAQNTSNGSFSIATDSVFFAVNESVVPLTLNLRSNNNAPLSGKINIETLPGISLIGKENILIKIDANSSLYYPIRLSVNKDIPAGITPIKLVLTDSLGKKKAEFNTKLIVDAKKQVQLINNKPNVLMHHVGDSLSISVLLSNRGNSKETVTLVASFPDLSGGKTLIDKKIKLNVFQDSVVVFKRIITKDLLNVEHYAVNIAALYSDGELINNVLVNVENVSGNRNYVDPRQTGYNFESFSPNKISLSGSNLFSSNEALQINGQGIFQLPAGSLNFSINSYNYTHNSSRPLLTNTYLNYELNNKGITIGNISESLETFINGRGVKVYTQNEAQTSRVEIGLVDKSYNLLGDQHLNGNSNGYTAFSKATITNGSGRLYTGSFLYDRSVYEGTESMVMMNHYQMSFNNKLQLSFDLGGGLTRQYSISSSEFKPSLAIGNSLSGTFGKYIVNSNNFYSTNYYPGVRRGVLQLNERISRMFDQVNSWISYSYYNYNPQYLENLYLFNPSFSNSRLEGGASFNLAKRLSLSSSISRISESGISNFSPVFNGMDLGMKFYRLQESLGWRSSNNLHTVYLSAENGFAKSPINGENKLHFRSNISWNYKFISLSSHFQKGDFTLTEVLSNSQHGNKDIYRFNVSPSIHKNFLNNKLKTQFLLNYNRDSYSGKNTMLSGNINYSFSKLFSSFVNVNFYNYKNSFYNSNFTTLQTGISYNLPDGRNVSSEKKGNMEIFTFFDNNTNGIFDAGDQPAEGRIIIIGNISFISQKDGIVKYKKVPYGDYTIKVPSQDWFAIVPTSINLQSRDRNINIPLQKTGKVTGSFYYNYDERTSMEVVENYGGLRVLVSNRNGYESHGLTNSNGQFTLFLPVGEYEFKVDENSLPKNVYTSSVPQKIQIEEGKSTTIPEIELKVKQRVIEVKRFSSE